MYNIGDLVIYSSHGVCRIDSICEKTYSGITRTYYVIHPIEDAGLTISAPVDKEQDIMQKLIDRNEAEEVLQSFQSPGVEWIEKNHDRTKKYSDIINTGDRKEISRIISTIMRKKHEVESNGKKLGESDRKLLLSTQNILFQELSISLDTTFDAIVKEVNRLMNLKD